MIKMQGRQSPVVEYRNPGFNTPTSLQSPAKAPQTVPAASQAEAEPKKVSAQAPAQKVSREAWWGQFVGKSLTFQCRSGAVITGTFAGLEKNWLKLTECSITGRNNRASTAWTMLDCNSISHFYGDAVLEAIDGGK